MRLSAAYDGIAAYHTVAIERQAPLPDSSEGLIISGVDIIEVGTSLKTEIYKAYAVNQYSEVYEPEGTSWTLKEPHTGVMLSRAGVLTILPDAITGYITIKAAVSDGSGGSVTEEKDVYIYNSKLGGEENGGSRIRVTVLDEGAEPIAEAKVDIGIAEKDTDGSGNTEFSGLASGSYLVEVRHSQYNSNYGFVDLGENDTRNVTVILSANSSGTDPGEDSFSISGAVYDNGAGLEGVSVQLLGRETVMETDFEGRFMVSGIEDGESVTLYFSKDGYKSVYKEYTGVSGDITKQFIAMVKVPSPSSGRSTVYGVVTDSATHEPLHGATVQMNGQKTTTDSSGYYAFVNVEPAVYTVTASYDGYNTTSVTGYALADQAVCADIALVNNSSGGGSENPAYVITGRITSLTDSSGISGAIVSDSRGSFVTTDEKGYYTIGAYSDGAVVALTATAVGFTAERDEVTVNGADMTKHFSLSKSDGGGEEGNSQKRLEISGGSTISVPEAGDPQNVLQLTAAAYKGTESEPSAEVIWQIEGGYSDGISIGATNGLLTVDNQAQKGVITVTANWNGTTASKLIAVEKTASTAKTVKITSGPALVEKPLSGSVQVPYTAEVLDQYGSRMDEENLLWSVSDSSYIIDGGILYVESGSTAGSVTVKATLAADQTLTDEKTVTVRENDTVGSEEAYEIRGSLVMEIPVTGSNASTYQLYRNNISVTADRWIAVNNMSGVSVDAVTGTVTVQAKAAEGDLILAAEYTGGGYKTHTITIQKEASKASTVEIRGQNQVAIPNPGEVDREATYTAVIRDQYGVVMQGQSATLSMVSDDVNVSFADNVLRVRQGAAADASVTISAVSDADSSVKADLAVSLLDVRGSVISSLVVKGPQRVLINPKAVALEQYQAIAYYHDGTENDSPAAVYSLQEPAPYGVTINPQTGELQVLPNALAGQTVVTADFGGYTGRLTINVEREASKVEQESDMTINGAGYILLEEKAEQSRYQVKATDQYGVSFEPENVTWSINQTTGAYVDAHTGLVTVLATFDKEHFTLTAKVDGIQTSKTVDVIKIGGGVNPEPEPGDLATLKITVQSENGAAISGAAVEIGAAKGSTSGLGQAEFADLAAGSYLVVVRHSDYNTSSELVSLTKGQTKDIVIKLSSNDNNGTNPGGERYSIDGIVYGGGEVLADVNVQLLIEGVVRQSGLRTDHYGRFMVNDIEPGSDVVLTFTKEGYQQARRAIANITSDIKGERIDLTRIVPPVNGKSTVYGLVLNAETGEIVSGATVKMDGRTAITGSSGSYIFADVEPGEHLVVAAAEGYNTASVTVEALRNQAVGADLLLTPNGSGSGGGENARYVITGRVISAVDNSPLGGASVTDGSSTVKTDRSGYYLIGSYKDGESMTITASAEGFTLKKEAVKINGEDGEQNFRLESGSGEGPNPSKEKRLEVEGDSSVFIPASGNPKNSLQLEARAYEGDVEQVDANINWKIRQMEGQEKLGVTVDNQGLLEVGSDAIKGIILIEVTWGDVRETKQIALLDADSDGTYLLIEGKTEVSAESDRDVKEPYQAVLYPGSGGKEKPVKALFELKGIVPSGVSLGEDGLLEVSRDAGDGYVIIWAEYMETVKAPDDEAEDLLKELLNQEGPEDSLEVDDVDDPELNEETFEPDQLDQSEEKPESQEGSQEEEATSPDTSQEAGTESAGDQKTENTDVSDLLAGRLQASLGTSSLRVSDVQFKPLGDGTTEVEVTYEAELIIEIRKAEDNGNGEGPGPGPGPGGPGGGGGGGSTVEPSDPEPATKEGEEEFLALDPNILKYLSGYPDGTIRPDNSITRAEAAVIFHQLVLDGEKHARIPWRFEDQPDSWYETAVAYLNEKGILSGYPDETFRGENAITRAEFAVIVSLFFETSESDASFSDLDRSHWAYKHISSVAAKGYLSGYADPLGGAGRTFRPDDPITRAEVVTVVNQMLGWSIEPIDKDRDRVSPFYDLNESHWARFQILDAALGHESVQE